MLEVKGEGKGQNRQVAIEPTSSTEMSEGKMGDFPD